MFGGAGFLNHQEYLPGFIIKLRPNVGKYSCPMGHLSLAICCMYTVDSVDTYQG